MKGRGIQRPLFISAFGAALATLAGLLLWWLPLGDPWTNASYDYLHRFGARAVTNQVTLILMDNGAFDHFGQVRGQPWDRALHARLLNRLADDGCALVAFDSFFRTNRDSADDDALAAAMRRQKHTVLMADQTQLLDRNVTGAQPILPAMEFLAASGTNWGVARLNPDPDMIVRHQWPFPSPGPYPSLPWTVAQLAGKKLPAEPQERWLRYYGQPGSWTHMSYQFAFAQAANYFRNQIVFIGNWPATSVPDGEPDKFSTPYTRWTGETTGGVEILATSFLNLLNDDSLYRPAGWIEFLLLLASGILLGGGLCRLRFVVALVSAAGIALSGSLAAICLSYFTDWWFPWLIIVGGQVPCALGWALIAKIPRVTQAAAEPVPKIPGYKLVHPPFGEGAYGKVWLARSKAGAWRAVKAIYLAKFGDDTDPYEREFNGIKKYQPVSDRHPGLLRVDFVSEKLPGYFYYVMELGDALEPGWERNPSAYRPRDLGGERLRSPKRRLPVKDCFQIGITLAEALDFLHRQGMIHRDIKPQNIIFVNGRPKLADLGLVAGIRPADAELTLVGTPGYMPPLPERPGTVAADIYALGMVLYVLCTGRTAALFPEVATTLVSTDEPSDFLPLNRIILKACQPSPDDRYASAAALRAALEAAQNSVD